MYILLRTLHKNGLICREFFTDVNFICRVIAATVSYQRHLGAYINPRSVASNYVYLITDIYLFALIYYSVIVLRYDIQWGSFTCRS